MWMATGRGMSRYAGRGCVVELRHAVFEPYSHDETGQCATTARTWVCRPDKDRDRASVKP